MSEELNEQLRPILQKRLKPGTRIVSHRFLLGDWKPEKTETVMDRGSNWNGQAAGTLRARRRKRLRSPLGSCASRARERRILIRGAPTPPTEAAD